METERDGTDQTAEERTTCNLLEYACAQGRGCDSEDHESDDVETQQPTLTLDHDFSSLPS
jgi:hypothetical protein